MVFDDVTFAYPGAEEPVLQHIAFTARPGTTTAIIGSTGAGKSTLVGLVPRLYDATSGTVRIDGLDIREAGLEDLWKRIGLVPQRPYLFSGTVGSNLRYGNESATDEEIWEALKVAQGADFVKAMPEGLDTPMAQGAPRSREASASACRSPVRSCASPRSCCSTTRSAPSTRPPTRGCVRR
ncbi:hypothetical protein GCM10025876_28410 [Demequina litorisediminis]|uniref:ABC transporter domain-containing protein n=1 Tax=Demequina litorisediminis TaxID=1849022 RepID=A0ABQ6IIS1_9MICO|nr:hypothetical protein GCM10025876_28410 [Demequina litorisediminis]